MHRGDTIFFKAVKEDENHTTELFCNLLKYDFVRNVFLSFFNKEQNVNIPIENIEYENIDTQTSFGENNKRPDIVIKTNDYKCFFEIKTNKNTDLQDSQLKEYPEELKKSNNKNLIFITPKNYKHQDSIDKLKKEKSFYSIDELEKEKSFVQSFYWEDFIRYIEKTDLIKTNILVSEFITFLKNVIEKQDLFLTLNLEEMALLQNPKDLIVAKRLLSKLYKIIDEVGKKVKEELDINVQKENDENEYAFYFKDKDKNYLLYFGLWFSMIENSEKIEGNKDYNNYFLCYGVYNGDDDDYSFGKYADIFSKKYNNEYFNYQDWLLNSFDKYDFAEQDEDILIDNISKQLIEVIKKLLEQ